LHKLTFYGKWNWIFSRCALALFSEVHSVVSRLQALELNVLDVKSFSSESSAKSEINVPRFLTRRSLFLQDLMSLIAALKRFSVRETVALISDSTLSWMQTTSSLKREEGEAAKCNQFQSAWI